MCPCLSANLFCNWKASRIASECCMDYQFMKHDGEYAAESMVKKMAAQREWFLSPLLFLALSGLLSPWKLASSKTSNFFKKCLAHSSSYLDHLLPSLEVGNIPCLKFRRKACAFMGLPNHFTLVHRSSMSGINCSFHSRIESCHLLELLLLI